MQTKSRALLPRVAFACSLALGLALCGTGCRNGGTSGTPNPTPGEGPLTTPKPKLLKVDWTEVNLGHIERDAEARAEFRLQNASRTPVRLSLGTPSCNCTNVDIEPRGELPAGETARVVMKLRTHDISTGGVVAGRVLVSVQGTQEAYDLSLLGFLEGPQLGSAYVIRPGNFEKGSIPTLKFAVILADKSASLTIDTITCQEKRQTATPGAEVHPDDGFQKNEIPSLIKANMHDVRIGDPVESSDGRGYARLVEVPITATKPKKGFTGEFAIRYQLRGKKYVSTLDCLILPPNESAS